MPASFGDKEPCMEGVADLPGLKILPLPPNDPAAELFRKQAVLCVSHIFLAETLLACWPALSFSSVELEKIPDGDGWTQRVGHGIILFIFHLTASEILWQMFLQNSVITL
jgi:hypothetical protein